MRNIVLSESTAEMLEEMGIGGGVEPAAPVPVPASFSIRNELSAKTP